MSKKKWLLILAAIITMMVLAACGNNDNATEKDEDANTDTAQEQEKDATEEATPPTEDDNEMENSSEKKVTVPLHNAEDKEVAVVTLSEGAEEKVHVALEATDLPPGKHAFHVHEKGVCEAPDFKSAGGHYNPEDKEHGKDSADGQHAGDFDNIEVNDEGKASVEFDTDMISLDEDSTNTLFTKEGTALVIHAGEDDYKSQPAGDAGDRIACGVIEQEK